MTDDPRRILVVSPSPLGDMVMATPALRALRARFPGSHVALLRRTSRVGLLDQSPWFDEVLDWTGMIPTAHVVREGRFDLAVVLSNSFRSALLMRWAGIPRRLGYARDLRGWLLTDKLHPPRESGRLVPIPAVDYYLALAADLGADVHDRRMELPVSEDEECAGREVLKRLGLAGQRPLVLLAPGAAFGPSKCWPAEYFARAADLLTERDHAACALLASPDEIELARAVQDAARSRLASFATENLGLGALKAVVRHADLVITNDTGPRHLAAALGTPVVTLFGPTDPRWTRIDCDREVILRIDTECGPCRLPVCPRDHRCMQGISPAAVVRAAEQLLKLPTAGLEIPAVAGGIQVRELDRGRVLVNTRFEKLFRDRHLDDFERLYGAGAAEVVFDKSHKGRAVLKLDLQDEAGRRSFYIKRYEPVRSSLRRPAAGPARTEWDSIFLLNHLGIRTMTPVALGEDPATDRGVLVTEEIGVESLEDMLRRPRRPTDPSGDDLAVRLAELVRRLHRAGLFHRDFYLCHVFLLTDPSGPSDLALIDLARIFRPAHRRRRWLVKDVAQVVYSCPPGTVRRTTFLRFLHAYFGVPRLGPEEKRFVRSVFRKVRRIARRDRNHKGPRL